MSRTVTLKDKCLHHDKDEDDNVEMVRGAFKDMKEVDIDQTLKSVIERGRHLDRLEKELYEKAGVRDDEEITVFYDEWNPTNKGLELFVWTDDFTTVLHRDGGAIAGMYVTFRGLYQAGGYIKEGEQRLYASDVWDEPHNVWREVGECLATDIARDAMTGGPQKWMDDLKWQSEN
jgi:hypothetical protein